LSPHLKKRGWEEGRPWLLHYQADGETVTACKACFMYSSTGHRDKIGVSAKGLIRLEALKRHERGQISSSVPQHEHKAACELYVQKFGSLEAQLPIEAWRRLPKV
jgi:hypothetical protein